MIRVGENIARLESFANVFYISCDENVINLCSNCGYFAQNHANRGICNRLTNQVN